MASRFSTLSLEPVDAYVFIDRIEPGAKIRHVLEDLFEQPGVRFVAQFVGSFVAFAAVHLPTLSDLHAAMASDYANAGVHCTWSSVVIPGPLLPKRGSPDYCGLVRVKVSDDPREVLGRLVDNFQEWGEGRHVGSAVVTGEYDILLSLGSDVFDDVATAVLDIVRTTDGVASSETAFAYLPGNAIERELPEHA